MFSALLPKESLDEKDVNEGLRTLVWDAVYAQTMMVLTTGAFLIGFALVLGASNSVIGILAGLGPFSLVVQVPSVYLVKKYRYRKLILVSSITLSRAVWFVIPAIPFFLPRPWILPVFLGALMVHYTAGNIGGCAFNSWIRDLIPQERLTSFFARRLAMATAAGALLSLAGAIGVDQWKAHLSHWPGGEAGGYAVVFLFAAVAGMMSTYYLIRTPEPVMPPDPGESFLASIRQPLHDYSFRQVLIFLGAWNFALNFATPFFAVYMIRRLELNMAWVIGVSVFSQLVNVAFFRFWGAMSDRFSNKSVLMITVPLFFFTFLIWPFTTMPGRYVLSIPLLLVIHALAGIATAGVNLCANNLALKLAPYGKGGAYLAVNAMVSGLAATFSPVIAGFSADWFETRVVTVTLHFAKTNLPDKALDMLAIDLRGLDFIFLIAAVLGLYAIHRLLSVREKGEVKEAVIRQAVLAEMIRTARQVSTVAGVRQIITMPFSVIRELGTRPDVIIVPPKPIEIIENKQ